MRKTLFIILGCALSASGTFADPIKSINFDTSSLWGKKPQFGLDDTGTIKSGIGTYWYYDGEEDGNESEIRKYQAEESPYDNFDKTSGNPQPSYMKAGANNKGVLSIAAADTLHRTFQPISDASGPMKDQAVPVDDQGTFVDALVQFTLANDREDPFAVVTDGAKLSCRLCRTSVSDDTAQFIITAGCIKDGVLSYTNYLTTAKVEEGKWYRLTAKMVPNACTCAGTQYAAFTLYLDGQLVACDPSEYVIGEDAAAFFAGSEAYDTCALFPSLQRYGSNMYANKLYSVGLQGTGMLDDLAITNDEPFQQKAASTIDMVLVCDDSKTQEIKVTITEDGEEPVTKSYTGAISGTKIAIHPHSVISFEPIAKPSYGFEPTLFLSGNNDPEYTIFSVSGYEIVLAKQTSFSKTGRLVVAFASKNVYFGVGDKQFATFNEAVAVASTNESHLISLCYPVKLTRESGDDGQAWVYPGQNIVLDLKGNTIKGDQLDDEATIYNQGVLQIIDSIGGGGIEAPGTVIADIRNNDAIENRYNADTELTIGDDESEGFTIKGRVRNRRGSLLIYSGTFLNPMDESRDNFYLSDYIADDRLTAIPVTLDGMDAFCVTNSGSKRMVRLIVPHGYAKPDRLYPEKGAKVDLTGVEIVSYGYDVTDWFKDGVSYDFDETVTKSFTLTAQEELKTFTIQNDSKANLPPSYTVESEYTELRAASRSLFNFDRWVDKRTGQTVAAVGKGATFVGTDNVVTGNLNLVAKWVSYPLIWENTEHKLAESNGVYSGSWQFLKGIDYTYPEGTRLKIRQIDFCVVNPTMYPDTAECLKVTLANEGGTVLSQPRTYSLDPTTCAYMVGTNKLQNGRAKVSYKFDNLTIEVGKTNYLHFATADGSDCAGFLRLMRTRDARYTFIGNCDPDESPIDRYREFCPAYEIYGEAVLTDE